MLRSSVLLLLLVPTVASAQETTTTVTTETTVPARDEGKRGFEIGLRAGLGLGVGAVVHSARTNEDAKLLDNGTIMVPLTLELGFRLDPRLYIGAFGSWSWIAPRKADNSFCTDATDSCSASLSVIGADVRFHPMPTMAYDPWISVGVGYEWLNDRARTGSLEAKSMFRGFQWVDLGLGADFTIAPRFTLGPYVHGALAQSMNYKTSISGAGPASGDRDGSIDDLGDRRVHVWLAAGVRGAFTL